MSHFINQNRTSPTVMELASFGSNGLRAIHKFGFNSDVDTTTEPEHVWDYGGDYTYSTTAAIDTISCSSVADTQNIAVIGLDENWLEVTQVVTLDGQTKVTLPTPLIRVSRMVNISNDQTDIAADLVGNCYLYEDTAISGGVPTDPAMIRAMMQNGNNQTLMALYTIPANYTGYIVRWTAAIANKSATKMEFVGRARDFGGVFTNQILGSVSDAGSSSVSNDFPIPIAISPKTDVDVLAYTDTNNSGIYITFDIMLVPAD